MGKSPSDQIDGKTFYNEIGVNDQELTKIFAVAGINRSKASASRVARYAKRRDEGVVSFYYIVGFCTGGKAACLPTGDKAEVLLTANITRWAGGANASYNIWMVNEKNAAAKAPIWCTTPGKALDFPIPLSKVDCAQGLYKFGWTENSPIPYKEEGLVYANDLDDWISGGYREASGGNDFVNGIMGSLSGMLTSEPAPKSVDRQDCGLAPSGTNAAGGVTYAMQCNR